MNYDYEESVALDQLALLVLIGFTVLLILWGLVDPQPPPASRVGLELADSAWGLD